MDEKTSENRFTQSIVFRISILFAAVAVVAITVSGIGIFMVQVELYEDQSIIEMQHIGTMLRDEINEEGDLFVSYQKYMLENSDAIRIPFDFSHDFVEDREEEFDKVFATSYPGMVFGEDVTFEELPVDIKNLFCTYYHAKWFLYFEEMADWFDVPYIYYVYPTGEGTNITYIFDPERTYEGDEKYNRLHLCDTCEESYEDGPYLFKTWEAGHMLDAMDSFDNEYGRTYSYYVPVIINEEKIGLVCVDLDIDYVNSHITRNVFILVLLTGAIMLVGLALLAYVVNRKYISKLGRIATRISDYSIHRDVNTADILETSISGSDEISHLGMQIADMMRTLDAYMKTLTRKEEELTQSHELAIKDALTGVRNKYGYDEELKQIKWSIENGMTDIGIAMIDLNNLKLINDTYGHEKGDVSIRRLCQVICEIFSHSPVFRIGGDEFVVILAGKNFKDREKLVEEFYDRLSSFENDPELKPWEKISAALGVAVFDPSLDAGMENVFKRADKAMYEKKREMK